MIGRAEPTPASSPRAGEPEEGSGPFAAVQLEFGFRLGPTDGRYLLRSGPEAPPERVIVLATVGTHRRRSARWRRRPRASGQPEPAPVPSARATIVRAEPFAETAAASTWLERLRRDRAALEAEVEGSIENLNRVLRAHRAAAADPYVREVRGSQALARRVGYGPGVLIADGQLDQAVELADGGARRRGRPSALSPQERLAAVLGGREALLACEELVLRARIDLNSRRGREAALQARIGLEAMLAELRSTAAVERERRELESDREAVALAANSALDTDVDEAGLAAVEAAVARMERILARHRSGSS